MERNVWGGIRRGKVRSIICLKGLPRNKMVCIMAREAMHAWFAYNPLRRDGVVEESKTFGKARKMSKLVEEGACQLVSYLYLKTLSATYQKKSSWHKFKKRDGPSNQKLFEYFQWEIENNPTPFYGESFRSAKTAYIQIAERGGDLKELLEHIIIQLDFPRFNT